MYCGNCGAKNADNAVFCESCGSKIVVVSSNAGASNVKNIVANKDLSSIKNMDKKKLGIIAGVIVLVIIALVVFNKLSKTVDLNDYLIVEYEGYNGYGHVTYEFDEDQFEADYGDKIKFKNSAAQTWGVASGAELVEYSVDGEFDVTSELSNDDEITFTWDVDKSVLASCNLTFKYEDKTYTVSGLEEIPTVDPFSYIDVEFEGVAPDGYADIVAVDGTDGLLSEYDFSLDKSSGLSEGDVVTVTFSYSADECISYFEMAPTETTKEYTVTGLKSYVTSDDQITAEALESMVAQGNDAIKASTGNWNSEFTFIGSEYVGYYFATAKFDTEYTQNELYLVYKISANYTDDKNNIDTDFYYVIGYENLMVDSEGVIDVDLSEYTNYYDYYGVEFEYKGSWGTYTGHYNGYATIADFESNELTTISDRYTYVSNISDTSSSDEATEEETTDEETTEE